MLVQLLLQIVVDYKTMNRVSKLITILCFVLAAFFTSSAKANPSPFVGEIQSFPYNFCPRGWTPADGRQLAISQNTALFSLYGTTFGGDGETTFNLPNLNGRSPVGPGQAAPGMASRALGVTDGSATVVLTGASMPRHSHNFMVAQGNAVTTNSSGNYIAETNIFRFDSANGSHLNGNSIEASGGSQPHENRPPFLVFKYCVAITGTFPTQ